MSASATRRPGMIHWPLSFGTQAYPGLARLIPTHLASARIPVTGHYPVLYSVSPNYLTGVCWQAPAMIKRTNCDTYAGPFWPQPAQPKWAHTTVSFPGCTAREGKSALNVTLIPSPRLIFSFTNLSRRPLSTAVVRPPISFFFESYASFSPFTPPCAVPVILSLLPLLFPLSTFHGPMGRRRTAEEYNRTAQENGWVLGTGAHEEEDNRQQTKNELSERYNLASQCRKVKN
jgi:hypothetical protein